MINPVESLVSPPVMVMSSAFGTTDLNCFPAFYPVGWLGPASVMETLPRESLVRRAVGSEGGSLGLWLGGGGPATGLGDRKGAAAPRGGEGAAPGPPPGRFLPLT